MKPGDVVVALPDTRYSLWGEQTKIRPLVGGEPMLLVSLTPFTNVTWWVVVTREGVVGFVSSEALDKGYQ